MGLERVSNPIIPFLSFKHSMRFTTGGMFVVDHLIVSRFSVSEFYGVPPYKLQNEVRSVLTRLTTIKKSWITSV